MQSIAPTKTKTVLDLQASKINKLEARITELETENESLKQMAYVDALTGCWNRRTFDIDLEIELARCDRSKESFAIILIDIDHFKKYNDTHGHQEGDALLSGLGNIWKSAIERKLDKAYRVGGEEFIVILPSTTKDDAKRIVEIIQRGASMMNVTVSMGVADSTEAWSAEELYKLVDDRLYDAKESGRNQAKYE